MGDCTKCLPVLAAKGVLRTAEVSDSASLPCYANINNKEHEGFCYVNITSKKCEGWLELFFGEQCIRLIRDVEMANEMRSLIAEKKSV